MAAPAMLSRCSRRQMRILLACTGLAMLSSQGATQADEIPEKYARRMETAEVAYKTAVLKADNVHRLALSKACSDRKLILEAILQDATSEGDAVAAEAIKARILGPGLADDIVGVGWQGSDRWGTFIFMADGTVSRERVSTTCHWVAIDDHSVLTIVRNEKTIYVDRLMFNKERNKVVAYSIGGQGGAVWEASRESE